MGVYELKFHISLIRSIWTGHKHECLIQETRGFFIHKHINVRFTLATFGETKVNMDNIFKICALWCKLPRFNSLILK
jgi:hypothetical protein